MEAVVTYMIPVSVLIDTETREVVRVLQENENIFLSEPAQVFDENWVPVLDDELIEDAIDITESADWPVWDKA
jgi:hypothetical protein